MVILIVNALVVRQDVGWSPEVLKPDVDLQCGRECLESSVDCGQQAGYRV